MGTATCDFAKIVVLVRPISHALQVLCGLRNGLWFEHGLGFRILGSTFGFKGLFLCRGTSNNFSAQRSELQENLGALGAHSVSEFELSHQRLELWNLPTAFPCPLWPLALAPRTWMSGHLHALGTRIIAQTWMLWPVARTGSTQSCRLNHARLRAVFPVLEGSWVLGRSTQIEVMI